MQRLDNLEEIRRIDREGMIDRIAELPQQCADAWRMIENLQLPQEYSRVDQVLVLGMGGSAIGGDLARVLTADEMKVPMQVCRDYDLPGYVGPDTLVIASSHSGNTEETLSALEQATRRQSKVVAVTGGGKLRDIVRQQGYPLVFFSYQAQPRAALGYSFILLLGVLQKAGLIGDKSNDVREAVSVLETMRTDLGPEVPTTSNLSKQLAERAYGRLLFVYGGGMLSEVARRWKGQINENGKAWAVFEALPELNHNAVVGYEFPKDMAERIVLVFLDSPLIHPRIRLRHAITQEILARHRIEYHTVESRGASPLAQMLSGIYVGDYTSLYLSVLYEVDPSPVEVISYLKQRLAGAPS
ncbi:MAG: bifunctional phosphoglucose/phosphomannose isomerase [Chloroflexi bacterium]|nr:bifunctional phosphoglucose/phosphomannose isomerase [Chloroflexota bacterium]